MKDKVRKTTNFARENGITLIALIITIIVLVILAAVTLNSIFGSNIIGIAINGALGYAEEQQKELGMLNNVSDILSDFLGDSNKPMAPSVTLDGTKGNNNIYTSDVTANISINRGLETTGTIKLHYSLSGAKTQDEQVVEEDVSIQITEEGTTTITAWTENGKGNLSDKVETAITINKTAPSSPMISLNGTEGENGYYISDVGVTISAGETANVSSIKYKVEGANPIGETESAGSNDVTFDITNDGTSTVTAYIINTAGLTSETITETVNKDSTNPSTATIALSGEAGETTIDVTASGADATSGVASYIFQISTTGNENDFTTQNTVTSENTSCTYQYTGLNSNTTYYLRVIVKDKAGNMMPSNIVNTTTKKAGINFGDMVEEEKTDYIGKYVDYTPEIGTFDDHVGTTYSGWNGSPANTEISTDTNLKWRILFIENNKLTLISDVTTSVSAFGLGGAEGYNNGVLLLNNACKEMYSNSSLGATGRSLNRADIESVSSYDPYTYATQYGVLQTDSYHRRYPLMFAKEINGQVDGISGTKYNAHEQDEYIKGTYSRATNSIAVTQTYYNHEMLEEDFVNSNPTYLELFRYMPGGKNNINEYWLASRAIELKNNVRFGINLVTNGKIVALHTFFNHKESSENSPTTNQNKLGIRPVVEIDLSKVNVGQTGTGAENDGYSLTLK